MKKSKMTLIGIISVIVLVLIVFQFKSMSTVELNHKIEINAPKEKVWQILNQLEAVSDYNPQVDQAKCISEMRTGVGASRECTMKDGSSVKERVVFIESNTISMELYESSWPVKEMRWTTKLSDLSGRTEMTQKLEYKVKFGAIGALLNTFVMKSKMYAAIQETFEGLKKHAEKD